MGVFLIFDLIILILLVVFAVRGAHRGLVLSLCGLVAVVVAFAGAGIAARTGAAYFDTWQWFNLSNT